MNLFDIIACPTCKAALMRDGNSLTCTVCGQTYPIIEGKPVLYPGGAVPDHVHESELVIRQGYDPWMYRVILQSLPPSALILDLGSGNMAMNIPNIVRMDSLITPYADVVGDAHALPFLPAVFDYILSLAVFEHLRNPFLASDEIYAALRNGGYIYHDCNFIFPYHGYPHHYFNASEQGLEQVFARFQKLRTGVAPFQMPSFGIRFILETYQRELGQGGEPDVASLQEALKLVLLHPLGVYDSRFSEESALRLAAGTYFTGYKASEDSSEVIPQVIQELWQHTPALQARFPDLYNLTTTKNIMLWAQSEGRNEHAVIDDYFKSIVPFHKSDVLDEHWIAIFNAWPQIEPCFGNIGDEYRYAGIAGYQQEQQQKQAYVAQLEHTIAAKNKHIAQLELLLERITNGRVMRILQRFGGR